MNKDPFNYIGNKSKLLPQLLPLFPTDINMFVDLFAGGASTALNTPAKKYMINDKNFQLINILKALKLYEEEDILDTIESTIEIFGLNKDNKEEFLNLRECYNEEPLVKTDNIEDRKVFLKTMALYTLITHSFNYLIHFNGSGGFSVPSGVGRSYFNDSLRSKLINYIRTFKETNVQFLSSDFRKVIDVLLEKNKLSKNDFVFVDPPYFISDDSYSRIKYLKWTEREEKDLYEYLDKLNDKGIRFALTNITEKGDMTNELLLQFAKKYKTIELDSNHTNCNYQKNRVISKEVCIINY
jgi:DNA adenine methylase Dam